MKFFVPFVLSKDVHAFYKSILSRTIIFIYFHRNNEYICFCFAITRKQKQGEKDKNKNNIEHESKKSSKRSFFDKDHFFFQPTICVRTSVYWRTNVSCPDTCCSSFIMVDFYGQWKHFWLECLISHWNIHFWHR